jgi:hypothetical protein
MKVSITCMVFRGGPKSHIAVLYGEATVCLFTDVDPSESRCIKPHSIIMQKTVNLNQYCFKTKLMSKLPYKNTLLNYLKWNKLKQLCVYIIGSLFHIFLFHLFIPGYTHLSLNLTPPPSYSHCSGPGSVPGKPM